MEDDEIKVKLGVDPEEEKDVTLEINPDVLKDLKLEIDSDEEIEKLKENEEKRVISKKRRIKNIILASLITIVFSIFAYILFNVLCDNYENKMIKSYNYGTKAEVNGHTMSAAITGEDKDKTIVFLPGFSSISAMYYRPLSEVFSENYKFVTMEPFGYGLSDIVDEERTVENITKEIHSYLQEQNIKKYYLMAHSIGGLYSLYYSNKYSDEVLGFVGFDITSPKLEDIEDCKNEFNATEKLIEEYSTKNWLGLNRVKSILDSGNVYVPLSTDYSYTDEDKEAFRNIELIKGFNKSVKNEIANLIPNLKTVRDMKFPKDIPVLNYISSSNNQKIKQYRQNHIDVGSDSKSNEVVVLPGDHEDFLFKHNEDITRKVDALFGNKKSDDSSDDKDSKDKDKDKDSKDSKDKDKDKDSKDSDD